MLFVREFEIVADEGGYLAIPFDMEGGTEDETARVAQMCSSGQLASWKVGSTRMVAKESIEERLAIVPQPGRPSTRIREIVTA